MHKLRVFRVSPVGRTIKFTHSATTNSVTTSSALVQNTKVNWASCTDFIAAATTGFFGPKHTHRRHGQLWRRGWGWARAQTRQPGSSWDLSSNCSTEGRLWGVLLRRVEVYDRAKDEKLRETRESWVQEQLKLGFLNKQGIIRRPPWVYRSYSGTIML